MNRKIKRILVSMGLLLTLVLLGTYLYVMFQPGLWYGDVFLWQKGAGHFAGTDRYARYEMHMTGGDGEGEIRFAVNDLQHTYRIATDPERVEIWEDGVSVFAGTAIQAGFGWILVDEHEGPQFYITSTAENIAPQLSQLFPSLETLYRWSVAESAEIRGTPVCLLVAMILGAVLAVDIRFPDAFFHMRHCLWVEGGEPSEIYRFCQKIGRGGLAILMLVCLVMGLYR